MEPVQDAVSASLCDDVLRIILEYTDWHYPVIYQVSHSLQRLCNVLPLRCVRSWDSVLGLLNGSHADLIYQIRSIFSSVVATKSLGLDYSRFRFLHTYHISPDDVLFRDARCASIIGPQIRTLKIDGHSSSIQSLVAMCAEIQQSAKKRLLCNVEKVVIRDKALSGHTKQLLKDHLPPLSSLKLCWCRTKMIYSLLQDLDVSQLEFLRINSTSWAYSDLVTKPYIRKDKGTVYFPRLRSLYWRNAMDNVNDFCKAPLLQNVRFLRVAPYTRIDDLLAAYPALSIIRAPEIQIEHPMYRLLKEKLEDKSKVYIRPFQYLLRLKWLDSDDSSHYKDVPKVFDNFMSRIIPVHPQIQVLISIRHCPPDIMILLEPWVKEHFEFVYIVP